MKSARVRRLGREHEAPALAFTKRRVQDAGRGYKLPREPGVEAAGLAAPETQRA